MITIPSTQTLEIIPAAGKTTNESPFTMVAAEVDSSLNPTAVVTTDGLTSTTAAVTILAAPASGKVRCLKSFTFYNADTVAVTLTIRKNQSSTYYILGKFILSVGDSLEYSPEGGFQVTDANGNRKAQPPTILIPGYSLDNGTTYIWKASSTPSTRPASIGGGALATGDEITFSDGLDYRYNGTYWLSKLHFMTGSRQIVGSIANEYTMLTHGTNNVYLLNWTGNRYTGAVDASHYNVLQLLSKNRDQTTVNTYSSSNTYVLGDTAAKFYENSVLTINQLVDCHAAYPNDVVLWVVNVAMTGGGQSYYGTVGVEYCLALP